jgi:hypothetical protein
LRVGSRWFKIESSGQAIEIGIIWLALTAGFEFFFGRYARGRYYNIFAGRIWIPVLIRIAIAPYLFHI